MNVSKVEGKLDWQIGATVSSNVDVALDFCDEERTELKGKVHLSPNLKYKWLK